LRFRVLVGGNLFSQTRRLAELAAKSRLPAMYSLRPQIEAGGLMGYGSDTVETWRRAATFVDKIIKGGRTRQAARRAANEVRARGESQGRQRHRPRDPGGSVPARG
jgi:ABC-type uncharacterized transport system substrate-binding protein